MTLMHSRDQATLDRVHKVSCPSCHVSAGEWCRTRAYFFTYPHAARRRLALVHEARLSRGEG